MLKVKSIRIEIYGRHASLSDTDILDAVVANFDRLEAKPKRLKRRGHVVGYYVRLSMSNPIESLLADLAAEPESVEPESVESESVESVE